MIFSEKIEILRESNDSLNTIHIHPQEPWSLGLGREEE